MELSSYSVTAYLVLLTISGIFDIFVGIYLRAKSSRRSQARKMFLRGCAWVIVGLSFLALFRWGALGTWTALTSAGALLILNEYLLVSIERFRYGKESDQLASEQKDNWAEVRARGKRHFVLIHVAVYGLGALWLGILLKVLLLEGLPFYLLAL